MRRMPWERALVLALLLGSCGQSAPQTFTKGDADRLEAASIDSRNAIAAHNALVRRVAELEEKARSFERMDTALAADLEQLQGQVNNNARLYNEHLRGGR